MNSYNIKIVQVGYNNSSLKKYQYLNMNEIYTKKY